MLKSIISIDLGNQKHSKIQNLKLLACPDVVMYLCSKDLNKVNKVDVSNPPWAKLHSCGNSHIKPCFIYGGGLVTAT